MAANQTDLVGTVWRDDMWLSNYPLNHHTAIDYFACSPFWDPNCNNVRARLEQRALTDLQGIEYTLDSCQEPHLFVICKQERQSADAVVPVMLYYVLDGSVYQTPTMHGVLSARLSRCMYSVQNAFLRLQKDLDPLMKAVPDPSKILSLPSLPAQHGKLQMRRAPSNEDMHSTNRIISHVLRKNALAAHGQQQQQSSMLSSEPSEFHLPQVRANTPAVSGAPQS